MMERPFTRCCNSRSASRCRGKRKRRLSAAGGFTLIELLVVITIITLLIGLLLPALSAARQYAKSVNALSCIRQLQMAYTQYADDNSGHVMIGYSNDADAVDREGHVLHPPVSDRYPWRIIKYLSWNWKSLYYDCEPETDTYLRSLYPRFGLNGRFMGGDSRYYAFDGGINQFGPFYARRIEDVARPSSQIVFGDSVYSAEGHSFDPVQGYGFYEIVAPYFSDREWNLDHPVSAKDVGYVAARWRGRATVTFVDGHSESRTLEQLDDMTLWAPLARSKTYVVTDGF